MKTLRGGTCAALAIVLVAGTILPVCGCSEKAPPPPKRTPLSPEMKAEFGAALSVPADVSSFSSSKHIARQLTQIWESKAVQSLFMLPLVQMAWGEMTGSPGYRQVMAGLDSSPIAREALPILQDAVSTEVFSCVGPEMVDFMLALSKIMNSIQLSGLDDALASRGMARRGPDLVPMIEAVLRHQAELQIPSLLVGFKLTDENAAKLFLDTWLAKIGPTPFGRIEKRALKGADFHVLELRGDSVPERELASALRELEREGVPPAKTAELAGLIRSLQLTVAVGVLDGYLMLSFGKDTSLVSKWGEGPALAESDEFEPLRAHFKEDLLGVHYVSGRMYGLLLWTPEEVRELVRDLIDAIPVDVPKPGLKERLLKDANMLADGIEAPRPRSTLAFSFENKGVESYSFDQPNSYLDFSEPLSILAHRGKGPIAVLASHAAKQDGEYDALVKWVGIAFGYFQDYVVPEFSATERQDYEKAMELALPFVVSVHQTTREYLLPAVDGCQGLHVFDGRGTFQRLPDGRSLTPVVPIPRLGIALALADPGKFVTAMERYFLAAKTLLDAVRKAQPSEIPPDFDLPSPDSRTMAGGTLYYYPIPWDLGADVFPCALIKDELLVLASSSALAEEMAQTVPMPAGGVTATDKPAGLISLVEFGEGRTWLVSLTDAVFQHLQQQGAIHPRDAGGAIMVRMHVDALWRSLRAFRSYRSTATEEDGRVVYHSWLHVEDVTE